MAALLRSARLLKSSHTSLLQVIGSSRHGPAAGRLYSGAVGTKCVGSCGRQTVSGRFNVNSLFSYRSALPCASWRQYGVVPEQRGPVKDEPSLAVRSKQAQQFDWALAKLDSSVRRTGRVTKTLLLRIFHDICRTGYPSGNQALLLLRSCGSLLPEVPLAERTELAQRIWDKLQELGAPYDVSHYNALLKTYLQNEFKFSPTGFLAKMEATNVQPNRVTYQRLIAAYCQHGDIEGASTILGFMKSKDLPITEAVFNSLVTGHARAGDMDSSESILTVMKGAGIEPGPDTYLSLLNVYAEKGDIDKIKETLVTVENADIHLMDRDLMQVVFSLTKAGHQQYMPEIVERMRHERGYVPDAMNLCLSLITQGHEDTAFSMLKSFTGLQVESQNSDSPDLGNFFLRHCINMDKSVEKMARFCNDLKDSGLHSTPLQFTLQCALEAKKTGMSVELMKKMKEGGLPVRPHYFWPLFTHHQKDKNITGILEVLRGMQELDVSADVDTFTTYTLPSFGSVDSARATLKEAGFDVEADSFVVAELRMEASRGNFEGLLSLMSSPTLPAIDLSAFRASLLHGFRGFQDVERMAKITDLLYKDSRFNRVDPESSENVPYFLYNLIDAMSETEVQSKEEKLREYFGLLKNMNITISLNIFRGIRNILESYHVPELIKDVLAVVDKKENGMVSDASLFKGVEGRMSFLEKTLAELKAEGKPADSVLKRIIGILCMEEKLDQALELKAQYETDMTPAAYAMLINLCCRHDNAEEALNLKRELARKDSEVSLDAQKYAALVRVLSKNGKLEEAVDMLKEMKEKDVQLRDGTINLLSLAMNTAAMKGDTNTVRRLQETIFSLGLAKPSNNLCAPLITCYLESGDYAGAFNAAVECNKQYNQMPKIHDLICGLVEKGDAELLQKVMEFLSQERGDMMMLYDLYFAFLQTGRYKEARKIIETPGLRARSTRLQWFAEKCISAQQMEPLENMVDMTVKLFECDRDDMYHYLFRLCKETNDWRKADAAWTKMQEENLIPRERTLRLLADILKSNNQEVPFEVPELWFEEVKGQPEMLLEQEVKSSPLARKKATTFSTKETTADDYRLKLLSLCKRGKVQEAYSILKEADSRGVVLGAAPYDALIKALLASGNIEDAISVKDIATNRIVEFKLSDMANNLLIVTHVKRSQMKDALETFQGMLQADQVPSQLAITRLVQGLGSEGNTQGIQEMEALVKTIGSIKLSSMLFVNNTALSHIKNGDIDSAVELLESVYTQNTENVQNPSISFVFRKVLDANNEAALDKLSAMAERLCNHFASYRAATDLFLMYLDTGRSEEAKFLVQRCAAIAEQKDTMFTYMLRASQHPGQAAKIKTLSELIPDFTEKENVYSYLVKCYGLDKDLKSAKAVYEQMQAEGIKADELTLKRLALLYREAGEAIPFQEPSESFRFYADKLKQQHFESATPADD
ncbi:leucine-rich PPR motif-containing protein, mitochondrial [Triplophysa rosa]|uniref:Leucine-rich PPR motif-containing protein n=1 Tax=Triplophysa rosa TaxID=992332 RepID=A0A9W7WNS5_TRIRA|nr:leucine-rich PPR motif-containing protein, mitochondrial [Triplophysa rosa]KAI7805611.1 leucine-rich PPR motif-containing protein [Triplophysa rosa]